MKQFLLKTLCFLTFSSLFYVIILVFWGFTMPNIFKPNLKDLFGAKGHMLTRAQEVKQSENVDILFLGSSHAYRGFDTRFYENVGFKCFNLGSSSQTPFQTKLLLDRYLDDLNPKLVVFEVYPTILSLDGIESALDLVYNETFDWDILKMVIQLNHIKVYNALLYKMTNMLLFNLDSYKEPAVIDDDTYIKGGFVQKELSFYSPEKLSNEKIELNYKQILFFEKIIQDLNKRGIKHLLVYAPIPSNNFIRYEDNKEFDDIMKSYADYYNFNYMLELDDSLHFYDMHHLNQHGVEKFNLELLDLLKKNYTF